MIFVGGVHGVGKTSFCKAAKLRVGVDAYSASALIAERKQSDIARGKLVDDVDANQQYLISAVKELNKASPHYILDGHFCLLNAERRATKVAKDIFVSLSPSAIIVLSATPQVIVKRLGQRDGTEYDVEEISQFQALEISYAQEVAGELDIPIRVPHGADELEDTLEFVHECFWETSCGR